MWLKCGTTFNDHFTANLLMSLSVKELRKSVQIFDAVNAMTLVSFLEYSVLQINSYIAFVVVFNAE